MCEHCISVGRLVETCVLTAPGGKTCACCVNPGPTGIRCCVCVGPVLLLCLSAVSVFCLFFFARPVARWAICVVHPRNAFASGTAEAQLPFSVLFAARWLETYITREWPRGNRHFNVDFHMFWAPGGWGRVCAKCPQFGAQFNKETNTN